MTPIDVLQRAREIVQAGGDNRPCEIGRYCLRCCIAIAKTELDDEQGASPPLDVNLMRLMKRTFEEIPSDAPLVGARELLAKKDDGITHTKESALKLLDEILGEEAQ